MHSSPPPAPKKASEPSASEDRNNAVSDTSTPSSCQLWDDTPSLETTSASIAAPTSAPKENRMGDILIRAGRLTTEDAQRILAYQQSHSLRFGEAAIALGLLTTEDLQSVVSQQYRYPTASNNSALTQFAIASAPFGEAAESIRKLRTEIMLRHKGQQPFSIAVLSPNDGEGKTHLSASLALAFAQNGYRTLLINADLRSPEKGSLLGTKTSIGLSTILAGRGIVGHTQAVASFPLLHALDAGPRPPNPAEILREPRLKDMINTLRESFDIFIVDTPSAKHYPDAQIIARQVDSAVLVARQHLTLLSDIDLLQETLHSAAVPITGIIYNSFQMNPSSTLIQRWLQKLQR
ncbi:polysaccharide biosynthesis tyrosine autokinase [Pusillimonas sp. CC-YST705]|uniref:Polysaccharide biosynthesis tyrosine autokinase n=1 Tax=Mesopusillimonas faecipullorum TaxID=2755040 RepID=A0ABS8CFD3_9BURK|nr:polysaccharide biosynthesis tyrosine autokinase [Mesopusillimonas faecipullorum]MCB5364547.1 polysaccharide biosynthesis tyrosine autokinase [Mesopusillimonas faecipullorum]